MHGGPAGQAMEQPAPPLSSSPSRQQNSGERERLVGSPDPIEVTFMEDPDRTVIELDAGVDDAALDVRGKNDSPARQNEPEAAGQLPESQHWSNFDTDGALKALGMAPHYVLHPWFGLDEFHNAPTVCAFCLRSRRGRCRRGCSSQPDPFQGIPDRQRPSLNHPADHEESGAGLPGTDA